MNRRSAIAAGLAALSTRPGEAAAQREAPVILGNVSLSFYAVTGAVVSAVLQRLGHRVEVIEGLHEQIFPLLGEARIDLMAAVWLPEGHAAYWQVYGANALEVATLYDGAHFFWAVPSYVPDSEVRSLADLAKPEVARRMNREIQGIGAGATISVLSRKVLTDYSLSAQGYSFRTGTSAEWLASYRSGVEQQRWMVFPTWTPQYLNLGPGLRPLNDPLGSLGGFNRASLVAPRDRFGALPEMTRRTLSRIALDLEAVAQMDRSVNVRQMSPMEAALGWMKANQARVTSWF